MTALTKTTEIMTQNRVLLLAPVWAAQPVAARKIDVAAARAGFADWAEWTLTGVVMTAVLLFGAGLLHFGVPACAARFWTVTALYAVASVSGLAACGAAVKAGLHLVRSFGQDRG